MSRRWWPAATALLGATWGAILWLDPFADERYTDVLVYASYAGDFLGGSLPYRDVGFEYPPLAAVVIALGGAFGSDYDTYRAVFAGLMLLAAALVMLGCAGLADRTGGDVRRALIAGALAPLLTGAMIRTHFDLVPVALVLGALLALLRDRVPLGFALVGVGELTKAFPLVLAPVALAWLLAHGRHRDALRGTIALVATVVVVGGSAFALSPAGVETAFEYQTERPVQVESAPAVVLRALGDAGGEQPRAVHSHNSDGLLHPAADAIAVLFALLGAGAIILASLLAARGARDGDPRAQARALVLGCLVAVCATAAFAKVLSPQFLVWTVPLLALACAWASWALAGTAAAAIVLTLVEFPFRYGELLVREDFVVAIVAARDALLIAAVALGLRALSELGRPSGQPSLSRR